MTRKKRREYMERYRLRHPERWKLHQRRHALKRDFGITLENYDRMIEEQGEKCAICGIGLMVVGAHRHPIDHDHKTGRIRGVLCHACNLGLGWVEKFPDWRQRIEQYLKVR